MRCNQRAGWISLIAVAAITWLATPVFAQGGSWGSSHGGSWGSSYGSYGSCGGLFGGRRPVRNLLGRVGDRLFGGSYGSTGSYGCYGSTGYSYGSTGRLASSGSRLGSWGSRYSVGTYNHCYMPTSNVSVPSLGVSSSQCSTCSMGTVIGNSAIPGQAFPADGTTIQGNIVPNYIEQPIPGSGIDLTPQGGGVPSVPDTTPIRPQPGNGEPAIGAEGQSTGIQQRNPVDQSVLALDVPRDAVVYINGHRTRTVGTLRRYVARKMDTSKEYRYNVEVQLEKNGQLLSKKDSIVLEPGKEHQLAFEFRPMTTVLTVDVPKGSEVQLCGHKTTSSGSHRKFTTRELVEGETWKGYTVQVKYLQDGLVQTRNREIDIKAGESRHLIFNFDEIVAK